MIIYFLRHASAGQHKQNPTQDEKRPLDPDGIEQCRDMGRTLAAMNVDVDLVISSPLKRATQTASLVANELGYEGKVQLDAALRHDASFEAFRRLLEKHAKLDAVMMVGHNPTLSEFLSLLISDGASDEAVDLKKGAIAKIDLPGVNKRGTLAWCITPKIVRSIYESLASSSRPKTSRK
jgi:phosphohistidine phosphatase